MVFVHPTLWLFVALSCAHCDGAAAAEAGGPRLQAQLADGSQLAGTLEADTLPFHILAADVRLALNEIRQLTPLRETGRVRLQLMGGDVLTGEPLFDAVVLRTVLGDVRLPVGQITALRVLQHTLYVSPWGRQAGAFTRWADAATNIQAAVDAAGEGDTVLVTNGVYAARPEIAIRKGVTVRSVNGPEDTIVDGGGSNRCCYIQHTNAVLDGFTLRHGYTGGNGGGLAVQGSSLVRRCLILSNRCDGGWSTGGGLDLEQGARAELCRIRDNVGQRGGGAAVGKDALLLRCTLSGNRASGEWGGGVFITQNGQVAQCDISGNQGGSGGGAALLGGALRQCRVHHNQAATHGAGVFTDAVPPPQVRECVISDNVRLPGAGCGGGAFLARGVIEDSLIVRNRDPSYGGGLHGSAARCTLAMNASARGHEVYGGMLSDCIIFNLEPQNLFFDGVAATNCCVSAPVAGANNRVGDPGFVDSANGDFRLRHASPCAGAGFPYSRLTNVAVGVESGLLVK